MGCVFCKKPVHTAWYCLECWEKYLKASKRGRSKCRCLPPKQN